MANKKHGFVTIDSDECKGCALCVDVCPPGVLHLSPELNPYGVHPSTYGGEGCTGCGICFYCCPEPGAITVYVSKNGTDPARASTDEEKNSARAMQR